MGKGGDNNNQSKKWVLIDGTEYDVTEFMKRHPGGNVLKYGLANTGADASSLYKAFHLRSKKADLVLKTLPKRKPECKIQPGQVPSDDDNEGLMLKDFQKFEQQLKDEGFFKTSIFHFIYRIADVTAIFLLGLWCFSLRTPTSIFIGVLLHGLFGGRMGWLQHEAGHGSMVENLWLGKKIQKFCIGFGLGTSGSLWNSMHNKHHAATQKVGHDMDLDTTPFVAFFNTAFETNKPRGFNKFWTRIQAYTFLPVTSGCFVMWFWLLFLHPRKVILERDVEQGVFMLASHIVRTALFKHFTGYGLVASYFIGFWGSMWVSGVYLFGHFSLSHTHLDVIDQDTHKSWLKYALEHTVDISPESTIVNYIMGYLNHQVNHHLFPQMPQFRQAEVSKRLKVFCEKHKLEYKTMSYIDAWKATLGNLEKVGQDYYSKPFKPKQV